MILYHGSSRKLIGEKLIPKQPHDVNNNYYNLIKGVYATDVKNAAIAMAIISSKGIIGSSLNINNKIPGTIYEGYPQQEFIYLYSINSENFRESGKHQFVSKNPVKPLKMEKLKIEDYLFLTRNANENEINEWNDKLKKWKEKNDTKNLS